MRFRKYKKRIVRGYTYNVNYSTAKFRPNYNRRNHGNEKMIGKVRVIKKSDWPDWPDWDMDWYEVEILEIKEQSGGYSTRMRGYYFPKGAFILK